MMNVLYCGSKNMFDGVMTSVLSILKRSEYEGAYNFYIYTMDLSDINPEFTPITDDAVEFLNDIAIGFHYKNRVIKVDLTELYKKEFGAYQSNEPYSLLKLLIDKVPNMPEKLLSLDIDVLFNKDIRLLYDIDVTDYEYAASKEHMSFKINTGVLLFNLNKINETKMLEKIRSLLTNNKGNLDIESALYKSTLSNKILSHRFNEQKNMNKNTVIRHFSKKLFWLPYPHTENIKQWDIINMYKKYGYHQFDDILEEYVTLKDIYGVQQSCH